MTLLNLLAALALLLWGCRQMERGLGRALAHAGARRLLPQARRGTFAAFATGLASGLLQPAARERPGESVAVADASALAPANAFVLGLGAHAGAAAAAFLLVAAPPWGFHALAIAGAATTLWASKPWLRHVGQSLFGAALALLALQILGLAAHTLSAAPLVAALAQTLAQDPWLSLTAGAVLALVLRPLLPAVLALAVTWSAWLQPQTAVAMLLGVQVGAAALAALGRGSTVPARRVAAARLLAVLPVAALGLLLRFDVARLLVPASGAALALLHLGFQALLALAFVHLAGPLMQLAQRWLPSARGGTAGQPGTHPSRLPAADLAQPSLALAASLREVMRLADLVDRMLRMARDVFVHEDAVALQAVRHAEQRVNLLYRALKDYLAQVPRQPLDAGERMRWEELLAFLVAAEQLADRIERMLDDLSSKKMGRRIAYPAEEQAAVLALHERLAANLRLAASVCLERGVDAARELAGQRKAFRRMEQALRAAHLARLVAGEPAAAAVSALHLDLLADYVDMNDQVCAFARAFLELRDAPAPGAADASPGHCGP